MQTPLEDGKHTQVGQTPARALTFWALRLFRVQLDLLEEAALLLPSLNPLLVPLFLKGLFLLPG